MICILIVYFMSMWSLVGIVYAYHNKLFYLKGDIIEEDLSLTNDDLQLNDVVNKYNNMLKKYNYMLEKMLENNNINTKALVTNYKYGIKLDKGNNIPYEILDNILDNITIKPNILSTNDKLNMLLSDGDFSFTKDDYGFFSDKDNIYIYKINELRNKIQEYSSNDLDLLFREPGTVCIDTFHGKVLDNDIIDSDKLLLLLEGKVFYNVVKLPNDESYTLIHNNKGIHKFIIKNLNNKYN